MRTAGMRIRPSTKSRSRKPAWPKAELKSVRRQAHRPDDLLVPSDGEAVGHAGNEVRDRPELLDPVAAPLPVGREERRVGAVSLGEVCDDALSFLAHRPELGEPIEPCVEKALQLALLLGQVTGKAGERTTRSTNVVNRLDSGFADAPLCLGEDVADHR